MSEEEIRRNAEEAGDPRKGVFPLEEAVAGLEGEGSLWVRLATARGDIECKLFEDQAPNTVANFVGLARGLRPFKDPESGEWKTGPYYDGTVFHRVIPGFMIQGGDPLGTGLGNAGYVLPEEIRPGLAHDRAGVLSMANRGPGTGSSQFFITLGPTPHLDGKHTIFGQCSPAGVAVADDIALTPRDQEDRPTDPEVVEHVEIFRRGPDTDENAADGS
jgi:peptidyl-prolyl cis-trans isomerase A (cyclophilin A)